MATSSSAGSPGSIPHKEVIHGLHLDLQWADVVLDASRTTPKSEGGFAQVSRVFWNGVAFALKQPKVKIVLTKRDLRDFMAEVQVAGLHWRALTALIRAG
jgi:hypothetical protein